MVLKGQEDIAVKSSCMVFKKKENNEFYKDYYIFGCFWIVLIWNSQTKIRSADLDLQDCIHRQPEKEKCHQEESQHSQLYKVLISATVSVHEHTSAQWLSPACHTEKWV